MSRVFTFAAPIIRRMPDPNFKEPAQDGLPGSKDRFILLVPVAEMPLGIPTDPNPRVPNTNRAVYRDVRKSLLNQVDGEAGTFHLKHKGITLVAESVTTQKGGGTCQVRFGEGHGILDGGHTYELICELLRSGEEALPEDQYVKVEILTHVPSHLIASLAGGLNTAIQVQPKSLDNLLGLFQWIKDELHSEPYYSKIAWREGEREPIDVRDLIAIMTCFHIGQYPPTEDSHPVSAHERKFAVLDAFEKDEDHYQKLRPILRDMLFLHDTIRYESQEIWNGGRSGRFGALAFVNTKKQGAKSKHDFPFIGKEANSQMMESALYPMLAAFRCMVTVDQASGSYIWRGGFDAVLALWRKVALNLLEITSNASREFGNSPNRVGKSRNHWQQLYTQVKIADLVAQSESNDY